IAEEVRDESRLAARRRARVEDDAWPGRQMGGHLRALIVQVDGALHRRRARAAGGGPRAGHGQGPGIEAFGPDALARVRHPGVQAERDAGWIEEGAGPSAGWAGGDPVPPSLGPAPSSI